MLCCHKLQMQADQYCKHFTVLPYSRNITSHVVFTATLINDLESLITYVSWPILKTMPNIIEALLSEVLLDTAVIYHSNIMS